MAGLPIVQDRPEPTAPKPPWLRVRAPAGDRYQKLKRLLQERRLHTVCSSAACPNVGECWNVGTATFMILGNECTRACRFCDVKTTARPGPVDLDEPRRLAEAALLMGLRHVVITSVARDDLPDGGANQFVRCITALKEADSAMSVEVLVPDFQGQHAPIHAVVDAGCEVFNHNLETVERLTRKIRSGAKYDRSLAVLKEAKRYSPTTRTKSGLMLGLGETDDEVKQAIEDMRAHDIDHLTLGQYLRPSEWHHPVERFVSPDVFDALGAFAKDLGFAHVESGPLVRSSYHAEQAVHGKPGESLTPLRMADAAAK